MNVLIEICSKSVRRAKFVALAVAMMLTSCAHEGDRIGFEQARAMFAARGVQPGQPLPPLSLVDLDGRPIELSSIQQGKPMVLVTASLTCNVARRQQKDVDALHRQFGDAVAVVVIYTIDAHPKGDVCPYTGKEWVPKDNIRDEVLVRQPTTLDERLTLARQYQKRFSDAAQVLVDTMDNASWQALGQAPNLGLLIDQRGIVKVRHGWFDSKAMTEAINAKTVTFAPAPGSDFHRLMVRRNSATKVKCSEFGDAIIKHMES